MRRSKGEEDAMRCEEESAAAVCVHGISFD